MKKVICHDINNELHEVNEYELRFRPSAYGILIEDNEILLTRQYVGYEFPGGGIEIGETIQDAVKREFFEETGLDVEVCELIHCETSFFHPGHSKKYVNEFWNCPLIYFTVKKISGELSIDNFDEEEKEYAKMAEWIKLSDVKNTRFINSVDSPMIIEKAKKLISL